MQNCKTEQSLNSKMMQLKSTDCKFFGYRLTPDGIKVDPKKIEAIIQMDPPQNVASLQSFNGMVNYLKKSSPVLSELSEPLRILCKSAVEWAWESEQQNALEAIKQIIMTPPVLAYFDKTKKHTIQCDASKKGLGAVLLQDSKPVMCVSRELTDQGLPTLMSSQYTTSHRMHQLTRPDYRSSD